MVNLVADTLCIPFSHKSAVLVQPLLMLLRSSVCTSAAARRIYFPSGARDKESTKDLAAEETASLSAAIILIFCYHVRNIVTRYSRLVSPT